MIKGGFQGLDISGVDLTAQSPTLPGGYATCQAAEGKTVLVLTATGAVQCSVKKVSTNYVLAGITGDGKILSITIGSTDGISVSETEIPSGNEPEVLLEQYITVSAVSESDPYTTQYDGILRLRYTGSDSLSSAPNAIILISRGARQASAVLLELPAGTSDGPKIASCFLKKGSRIYGSNIVTGVTLQFYPYKPA